MRAILVAATVWTCLAYGGARAAEPPKDTAPSVDAGPSLEERVQEILNTPAEDIDVAVRCIRSMDYVQVEVLDDLRLVFRGRGDKRWLNQLRGRCPGLRKRDTLQFEMRSIRLCDMDSFRSIDPSGLRALVGPSRDALSVSERVALPGHLWALLSAEKLSLEDYANGLVELARAQHRSVVKGVAQGLSALDHAAVDDAMRPAFASPTHSSWCRR